MRGALAAGIVEMLLLTSLTLAGVKAARMMPTMAKVELIIEDTPRLKPKWQNNVNAFLSHSTQWTGKETQTEPLGRIYPSYASPCARCQVQAPARNSSRGQASTLNISPRSTQPLPQTATRL